MSKLGKADRGKHDHPLISTQGTNDIPCGSYHYPGTAVALWDRVGILTKDGRWTAVDLSSTGQ